jgi:hypothetical protein
VGALDSLDLAREPRGIAFGNDGIPTLSAFRQTIGEILEADLTGATPANIFPEVETVHSSQQLALALAAESSWSGDFARIAGTFDRQQLPAEVWINPTVPDSDTTNSSPTASEEVLNSMCTKGVSCDLTVVR